MTRAFHGIDQSNYLMPRVSTYSKQLRECDKDNLPKQVNGALQLPLNPERKRDAHRIDEG